MIRLNKDEHILSSLKFFFFQNEDQCLDLHDECVSGVCFRGRGSPTQSKSVQHLQSQKNELCVCVSGGGGGCVSVIRLIKLAR